jgi:hypothetical protein
MPIGKKEHQHTSKVLMGTIRNCHARIHNPWYVSQVGGPQKKKSQTTFNTSCHISNVLQRTLPLYYILPRCTKADQRTPDNTVMMAKHTHMPSCTDTGRILHPWDVHMLPHHTTIYNIIHIHTNSRHSSKHNQTSTRLSSMSQNHEKKQATTTFDPNMQNNHRSSATSHHLTQP